MYSKSVLVLLITNSIVLVSSQKDMLCDSNSEGYQRTHCAKDIKNKHTGLVAHMTSELCISLLITCIDELVDKHVPKIEMALNKTECKCQFLSASIARLAFTIVVVIAVAEKAREFVNLFPLHWTNLSSQQPLD